MKILTVLGARPQFIKAAVISRAIEHYNKSVSGHGIDEIIVHTGQHYDNNMSEIFFKEMVIPKPQYNLGVNGGLHGEMTGTMLIDIESVLVNEKPDLVLVYGDTNTTLAGALAAAKLLIPVAHVEAGLRSFNMNMPEEINRILTDHVSRWLFCPTKISINNLNNEGLGKRKDSSICLVGDVMYDAVLFYKNIAKPSEKLLEVILNTNGNYYLSTIHRAENTDIQKNLENILNALNEISSHIPVIIPLHPRTQKLFDKEDYKNIIFLDPVGYFDIIYLLSNCIGVFTDSGGLQKEAYYFRKPCVILREETEWIELVEGGYSALSGSNFMKILELEKTLFNKNNSYDDLLYGDGQAGNKIVEILVNNYQ